MQEVYYLNGQNYVNKESNPPHPITSMYWFDKDEGGRKIGHIYFGTTNGLYLRKAGESTTTKIAGIDGEVKIIQSYIDKNNSAHIITTDGNAYYLNGNEGYVNKEINIPYPITTIYIFTKNEYGRKIGDIYFGTTNGLYLRKAGESTTTKIAGIDGEVKIIYFQDDGFNSVQVVTKTNENENNLYYLNGQNYVNKESNPPHPITSMYWFDKDEGGRKIGHIYFGTTNGLYLRKAGESTTTKIAGINSEVTLIYTVDNNRLLALLIY